jgi:hypothetical protein
MKFRKDPKIEELLNGYIDGELSAAEDDYVQQLVSEDKDIAALLRRIERCRMLVSSLPPAEPPAEVVAQIKSSLRSRLAGVTGTTPHALYRTGARHLFARQALTAAAMIGLVGILAAVIYRIMVPAAPAPSPVALQPQPVIIVTPASPDSGLASRGGPKASPAETIKTVAAEDNVTVGFYSIRLATTDFTAADSFINKLLDESSWLKYNVTKQPSKRSIYRVLCSKGGLVALVSDLSPVWSKFDSASLVVYADNIEQSVSVQNVRPEQITEIANQDTADGRIRLAKDFALLNNAVQTTPAEKMLALSGRDYPELTAIPKPALTSGQKETPDVPKGALDQVRVDLTIVVTGHK